MTARSGERVKAAVAHNMVEAAYFGDGHEGVTLTAVDIVKDIAWITADVFGMWRHVYPFVVSGGLGVL